MGHGTVRGYSPLTQIHDLTSLPLRRRPGLRRVRRRPPAALRPRQDARAAAVGLALDPVRDPGHRALAECRRRLLEGHRALGAADRHGLRHLLHHAQHHPAAGRGSDVADGITPTTAYRPPPPPPRPSSSALPKLSNTTNLLSGAFARAFAGFILMPLTVIKVRYESSMYSYRSVAGAARDIYRTERIPGFFAGFGATAMRDAPYAGLYVVSYEQFKKRLGHIMYGPGPHAAPRGRRRYGGLGLGHHQLQLGRVGRRDVFFHIEPVRCRQDAHPVTTARLSEHVPRLSDDGHAGGRAVSLRWLGVAHDTKSDQFGFGMDVV
ncbi:hypothetical protein CIB48_g11332 [Xylaria polymorpha]|nr:hypothetical protein CIB48_g11332 [Xylaria polymorpha]